MIYWRITQMKSMDTTQLLERLDANEDLNIIDVREDDEVAQGVIPGAQHIALGTIPERLNELDSAKPYIIVCKAGARSANACAYLEAQGFDVTNLEGGMLAYDGELEFK